MTIFCRHADCGKPHECAPSQKPPVCPACQRVAAWSTAPGVGLIHGPGARTYTWADFTGANDCRFLRSIKVAPEKPDERPRDAALDLDDTA